MFSKGFSCSKCKPALVQSIIRIGLLRNKRVIEAKKGKTSISSLLAENKIEKARLEAEQLVQIDFFVEALDILELMCGMLRDNCKLIEISKNKYCSNDMLETVSTIFFCSERIDIPELNHVRKQLVRKYGQEYLRQQEIHVNKRIKLRLSAKRPNAYIVLQYMKEIAAEKNIPWEPDQQTEIQGTRTDIAMDAPSGLYVKAGSASDLGLAAYEITDGTVSREYVSSSLHKVTNTLAEAKNDSMSVNVKGHNLIDKATQTHDTYFNQNDGSRQEQFLVSKQNIPQAVLVNPVEEEYSQPEKVLEEDDLQSRLDRLEKL